MKMPFLAPPKIQGVVAWYQGSSGVLGVLAFFLTEVTSLSRVRTAYWKESRSTWAWREEGRRNTEFDLWNSPTVFSPGSLQFPGTNAPFLLYGMLRKTLSRNSSSGSAVHWFGADKRKNTQKAMTNYLRSCDLLFAYSAFFLFCFKSKDLQHFN